MNLLLDVSLLCFVLFCFVLFCFFSVTPHRNCRLKLLKSERIKDYLLLEEEFIQNQERLKPQEEKNEVHTNMLHQFLYSCILCMNVHVHILYISKHYLIVRQIVFLLPLVLPF